MEVQQLGNEWDADHVFQHDPLAIECFLLDAFLAYNILHAFLALNIKPQARNSKTRAFWVSLITAELYAEVLPTSLSP